MADEGILANAGSRATPGTRRAADIDMHVKGSKQGDFKGQSIKKGRKADNFDLYFYQYQIESPRDVHSGLATGKRMHHPIVVEGEVTAGYVNLQTAIQMNEVLTAVKFEFWKSIESKQTVWFTVELENGVMCALEEFTGPDGRLLFAAAFTFQKITQTFVKGGYSVSDDWSAVT
jgi:type VI secretion system secreted protein Hcp